MIFLLDTNVISEAMKPRPSPAVASWMRAQAPRSMFTAALCQAEILSGIAVLPAGRRRDDLKARAEAIFSQDFEGRVLSFNSAAAEAYAEIFAMRRQKGRPIAIADLLIAAIASANDAAIVTRDVSGFEECGLAVIDPWS